MAGLAVAAAAALATTGAAQGHAPTRAGDDACTVAAGSGEQHCYGTFAEAVESITGETITDPAALRGNRTAVEKVITSHNARASAQNRLAAAPAPTLQARSSLTAVAASSTSDLILGAVWADKNWTGKVKVLYGSSGSGCYGVTYGFPHTRNFGMNDNISSLSGYMNCATTIYKDANYKSTSKTIQVETSYVGDTMNDETSSIVYRPRS